MTTKSIHDMTDEEFDALGPSSPQFQELEAAAQPDPADDPRNEPGDDTVPAEQPEAATAGEGGGGDEQENNEPTDVTTPTDPTQPAEPTDAEIEAQLTPAAPAAKAGTDGKSAAAPATDPATKPEAGEPATAEPGAAPVLSDSDYADIGKRMLAPFKANGREIKVKSADDAVQLMQMGANYNHKMAALKPSLATLKLLERNELLDPEKINYMIDLFQKKPEAIAKLVKESGLDPMDMDTSKDVLYSPTQRTVPESELAIEAVLDELKGSSNYSELLQTVGNVWDEASRTTINGAPQMLKVIHSHMEQGVYPRIAEKIEYERSLGRLSGLSDIQAYQQIGDAMYAAGEFNDIFKQPANKAVAPQQVTAAVAKPGLKVDPKTAAQRKAVGSTTASVAAQKKSVNPLDLSDAEFEKMDALGYLNKQ